jgi:hypothetical protein
MISSLWSTDVLLENNGNPLFKKATQKMELVKRSNKRNKPKFTSGHWSLGSEHGHWTLIRSCL